MSSFKKDLRVGESMQFDVSKPGRITVHLEEKSGQRARFSIDSNEDEVKITYNVKHAEAHAAKAGLTLVK